ncbi:MAG: hypothetical protein CVU03_07325 [Bacteroidetes bacterium HGW-Bacteroidetes-2]|jgi:hypothetical protein|nr:MAG: hypothetical protein CVU03_07325 [Bacteroidetes bacterium HGW-Bacteroidetes-2]
MPNSLKTCIFKHIKIILIFAILYITLSSLFSSYNKAIGIFLLISLCITIAFFYNFSVFKIEYIGYQNKIWAHQVNTIKKLKVVQSNYYGIELDIVFDSITHTFDVHHPPESSIGLTLETYLTHLKNTKNIGIWLDFKNLNEVNSNNALNRLLFLTEKYQLNNNNIIVESQHPKHLKIFQEAGFKTSYYLPSNLHKLSSKDLSEKINDIKLTIKNYTPAAISTNSVDYAIVAKHFPEQSKYLWSIDKTFTSRMIKNFIQTRKVLKDPKAEVLLVRVNRKKGNR